MITRTQSISHRNRQLRTLFGGVCAAAIFGAPLVWTQLDAPPAHAVPVNCPMSPSGLPECPRTTRRRPRRQLVRSLSPAALGTSLPRRPLTTLRIHPFGMVYNPPDGKPDKSEKPGSPPDGKPGSPGTGGDSSQSSPPAGVPNAPDHSAPATGCVGSRTGGRTGSRAVGPSGSGCSCAGDVGSRTGDVGSIKVACPQRRYCGVHARPSVGGQVLLVRRATPRRTDRLTVWRSR